MLDVLFIDDDLVFAQAWCERVVETMQVKAYATASPEEAIRLAHNPGVKIAVIDEVLTGTGTDGVSLGLAIRGVDPRVRWILLSGEATGSQITVAYDSGLQRHIHKNDAMTALSDAIHQYLIEYRTALAKPIDDAGPPLFIKRTNLFRRQEVRYYLVSLDSIDRDCVVDGEWRSHTQVNSGEKLEETLQISWSRSDSLEFSSETQLSSEARLGSATVVKLSAALRSEVTQKEQLTTILSTQRSFKLVRTLSLPREPADPSVLHISSRMFQVAPVYVHVVVTIVARCSCCGNDEPLKGHLYLPRSRYATRQEDFLSDGSKRITMTGFKDVPEPT
jgi:ActR/RegA family two-component response regulator